MSKRRRQRSAGPTASSQSLPSTPAPASTPPPASARPPAAPPPLQPRGFNPDYSYVFKDLRRIGLLAGSLIAVLIVLSFFLR